MLEIVIGIVLLAHGIGHVLGLFPVVGVAPTSALPRWTGESWVPAAVPARLGHLIGGVLWIVALVGFVLLSAVVLGWLDRVLVAATRDHVGGRVAHRGPAIPIGLPDDREHRGCGGRGRRGHRRDDRL